MWPGLDRAVPLPHLGCASSGPGSGVPHPAPACLRPSPSCSPTELPFPSCPARMARSLAPASGCACPLKLTSPGMGVCSVGSVVPVCPPSWGLDGVGRNWIGVSGERSFGRGVEVEVREFSEGNFFWGFGGFSFGDVASRQVPRGSGCRLDRQPQRSFRTRPGGVL